MIELHHALGSVLPVYALVVMVVAAVAFVLRRWRIGQIVGPLSTVLVLGAIVICLVQVALGPLLLLTGHAPADLLHVMYGLLALITLPFAYVLGLRAKVNGGRPGIRDGWVAMGGFVLFSVALRLTLTG